MIIKSTIFKYPKTMPEPRTRFYVIPHIFVSVINNERTHLIIMYSQYSAPQSILIMLRCATGNRYSL